jgi:hypothetical protein
MHTVIAYILRSGVLMKPLKGTGILIDVRWVVLICNRKQLSSNFNTKTPSVIHLLAWKASGLEEICPEENPCVRSPMSR